MCPKLCKDFKLIQCRGNSIEHGHGKHVALLECTGCLVPGEISRVIMKEPPPLPRHISLKFTSINSTIEQAAFIKRKIVSRSKSFFGVDLPIDLDIVGYIFSDAISEQIKEMNNTMSTRTTIYQTFSHGMLDEFLSLKVLGSKPFLPKLYGVCGPAYFVEFTLSLVTQWYVLELSQDVLNVNSHVPSWMERAEIGIKFMDLILTLEDGFKSPIQMCDVKGENFGINAKGDISILDSDALRFDNVIPDIECSMDNQCALDTCHGVCNKTSNRCSPFIITTNLQTICKRIFIGRLKSLGVGLLRNPPGSIYRDLSSLVSECLHPRKKNLRLASENKSDRRLLFAIKDLLKKSILL